MAEATPRSARQGIMLPVALKVLCFRDGDKGEPRPKRPTRIHQNLVGIEARDVFRGWNRMNLVPV
jgi:hypothetical protein